MTANTEEGAITIKKFRGCLLGALVGDCLGAPFEEDGTVSKKILQKYFDKMDDPNFKCRYNSFIKFMLYAISEISV